MDLSEFPIPTEGFVVTQFLTVRDAIASANYYAKIFGGKVLHEGHPSIVKLAIPGSSSMKVVDLLSTNPATISKRQRLKIVLFEVF